MSVMPNIVEVKAFLYREARLLDDERWDDWLACYAPNASFWMPSWYYPDRQGLEDRVFRIKTERSSATMPDTRTSHNISNVEIIEQDGSKVTVRFNWNTLSYRYKKSYSYFGMSRYEIDFSSEQPQILSKYVVLKNDYINQVIDIYHL